ncbi:tetratricopeptide repeat protein [Streptomyces microflavus]
MLRRHVDDSGKTLAVLGAEINVSKAQAGVHLAGKVPTKAFIAALIGATIRPELRERRQEEALALREQALRSAPHTTASALAVSGLGPGYAAELAAAHARQIETYDRLTRALEQQAEEKQRQVGNLETRVQDQLRQLAGELDRLRASTNTSSLTDDPAENHLSADTIRNDVDAVLTRASAIKDEDNTTLSRVTSKLDDIAAEVVQGNSADSELLRARHSHAVSVGQSGDPERAAALLDKLIPDYTRILGPDHPDTLRARHGHAIGVGEANAPEQAAALLNGLLRDCARALGRDHPDTLRIRAYRRRYL